MKRLLAFILVVAMALAFAGSASAFSWEKPAQPTPEKIGYSIDVLKCTLVTGEAGSSYYNVDDNAVAVNGADVYWAVKLTVDNPSNQIKSTAYADVEISGLGLSSVKAIPLSGLDSGVYYFMPSGAGGYFQEDRNHHRQRRPIPRSGHPLHRYPNRKGHRPGLFRARSGRGLQRGRL